MANTMLGLSATSLNHTSARCSGRSTSSRWLPYAALLAAEELERAGTSPVCGTRSIASNIIGLLLVPSCHHYNLFKPNKCPQSEIFSTENRLNRQRFQERVFY